ncbi:hypothetical protein FH972_021536 [Carpinus fangiana]|uniref:Zn(2)-C6 fungal-type domain-containing protein n=1 Tax=Carpinus fangiana TaxID=176857 RepID=A0A5N6KPZ7_9ROSI|nr:hypothetical protein FH972_021536 [Carpinus fangiana]
MYTANGGTPSNESHQQTQAPPRQWDTSPQAQYENGPYPSRPNTQPPTSQAGALRPDRPEMAILHPQPPYAQQQPPQEWPPRLPPTGAFYTQQGPPQGPPPPHGHHDPYRQGPPPQGQQNMGQSAPRQRTAIACKYCRRRKIRCSGFENSEDGRCSNCVRFSQECVFTPVSAQTQAFVPAQALYSRGNRVPPPEFYGNAVAFNTSHQQGVGKSLQPMPHGLCVGDYCSAHATLASQVVTTGGAPAENTTAKDLPLSKSQGSSCPLPSPWVDKQAQVHSSGSVKAQRRRRNDVASDRCVQQNRKEKSALHRSPEPQQRGFASENLFSP